MKITDVAWIRDAHGKQALQLKLDGHPLHVRSGQRTMLTERGILDGVVFLNSERTHQLGNPYIHGDYASTFSAGDLVGCTDDAEVFALYLAMCDAIRTDSWHAGARPTPA